MEWHALENNECPKCGAELREPDKSDLVLCSETDCDFGVRKAKLDDLVDKMEDEDSFAMYD